MEFPAFKEFLHIEKSALTVYSTYYLCVTIYGEKRA